MALYKIELGAWGISEAVTVNDALGYFEWASRAKFDGESGLATAYTARWIYFSLFSFHHRGSQSVQVIAYERIGPTCHRDMFPFLHEE